MARENQSLQIALIVCVMLTIILGVTTFIFYRQYAEADTKYNAARKEADDNKALAENKTEENKHLKKVIGFPEADELQAIDPKINEDMQTYAGTLPEDSRVYRQVAAQLYKALQEKSAALAASQAEAQTVKDEFKAREAGKDGQIKQFEQGATQASQDLDQERKKFNDDRERAGAIESDLTAKLQKSEKKFAAEKAEIQGDLQNAKGEFTKVQRRLGVTTEKLEEITKETFEQAYGEITWVDPHDRTAWINLGEADRLRRQTTFGVWAPDATDVTKTGKKASIEVTQVVGGHIAQVRITDEKPSNPVMIGDKIYTPLWAPGQRRHFALAGLMDVYGDGKNNHQLVHDLIKLNGGEIDCEADAKGEIKGQITVDTRYLVLGDEFKTGSGKEVPQSITARSKIYGEAQTYRLQIIPLADLLRQMGWKNQTPDRYGPGANPKDFLAKPAAGTSQAAGGAVSELFKPRTPPQGRVNGAY